MVSRYCIGTKLVSTGAVAEPVPVSKGLPEEWTVSGYGEEGGFCLSFALPEEERIYGLGETVRGMNKRGWLYTSNNTDDPIHLEGKHSLYASHNFLLFIGERVWGIFVDNPGTVDFDLGYTCVSRVEIRAHAGGADLYVLTGKSPLSVITEFRRLIGKSYIPPKWAFGYGQSRWSYKTAGEVREVVRRHREAGVPLDMVYLDIDYMDHFKDFTIDEEAFPNFPAFVQEMKGEGVRLVPIIDAGVKIEEGYETYEEGIEGDYFCKKEDGTPLVAAVWPGQVHFPDFLKPEAAAWFGESYRVLLEAGIEGFWNDMNEPAIFYTQDYLNQVFAELEKYKGQNMDLSAFFAFRDLVGQISNRAEDYKSFYHETEEGRVRHDLVHNLYGAFMTRAAGEAFERLCPEKRILLFSRASYIGSHRYGGVWTGDNKSWWSHLLLNLQQLPGLNMAGYLFSGADIGGFGDDCTQELLLRWMALGIFTPLFRNHSALGTRRQEFYAFEDAPAFARLVKLRYQLIPYLYASFLRAVEEDGLLFTPLGFAFPEDERAWETEDQLLVGESLMIAPVYTPNVHGRMVYLPERMLYLRVTDGLHADMEGTVYEKGDAYVPLNPGEAGIFLRPGKSLPFAAPARCVEELGEVIGEIAF